MLVPSSAEETSRLAREAARGDYEIILAAGGDGTVNAVARGLAGTTTPLGILPLGTANDLVRELGMPRDVGLAAQRIVDGVTHAVDMVEVNGRPFVGVGGLALASRSALAVTRFKARSAAARNLADLFGGNVYRLSASLHLLGRWRVSDAVRVQYRSSDGAASGLWQSIDLRIAALFVVNHRTTGGGLVLPVPADPADGVFELGLVPERARSSLLVNFARLSAGLALPAGVLVPIRATEAVIETDHEDAFVADGELLATSRRFDLRILPGALHVVG